VGEVASGVFKRGEAPLSTPSPSLTREGDKGGRLLKKGLATSQTYGVYLLR